jgi:hypothetical protein
MFVVKKGAARPDHEIQIRLATREPDGASFQDLRRIPQSTFRSTFQNVFDTSISPQTEVIKDRMRQGQPLGAYFDIRFGIKTGDDTKFLHSQKGLHKEDRPILRGDDVRRYGFEYKSEYVWYVPERMRSHRSTARPGEAERFEQPKVLVKDTSKDFGCTYDDESYYVKDVLIVTPRAGKKGAIPLRALAGILNSRLMYFYYRTTFRTIHVQNEELASLPLPPTTSSNQRRLKQLDARVAQILKCNLDFANARTPTIRTPIQRKIATLEIQINQVVYELYGIGKIEARTIENSVSGEVDQ